MGVDRLDFPRAEALQGILHEFERLFLIPIRMGFGDDLDIRSLDSLGKAGMTLDRRGDCRVTLDFDDIAFATEFFDDKFASEFADRLVMRPDMQGDRRINTALQGYHGNTCGHDLFDGRGDCRAILC